jgi:hypothetical protein
MCTAISMHQEVLLYGKQKDLPIYLNVLNDKAYCVLIAILRDANNEIWISEMITFRHSLPT